jgi:two-component system NtrC family sensor kinase
MEPITQILIVEDSETQALQLRFLLEEEGWEVVRASTAESALEELNRRLPALIVADYHLPGMRGDELCRKVRLNVDTRGIPILMLTADEASASEPAGLDSGADDYLAKSVTPEILLLRVRALLRNSGERSSVLSPQEAYFRRARLLAIDDSPTYLESLAEAFHGEGHEVTTAASAKEGLERIAEGPFDCVMVDLVMPEMDGIEVCRRIHAMGRSMDHPMIVIMLTSSETKGDMTRGLEAGADDFVGKSSDMAVLKARIRALLRRKFFQEENRRIREQLLRTELEATEARAARELAETRSLLVDELERKNKELERSATRFRTICGRRCAASTVSARPCSRTMPISSMPTASTTWTVCAERRSAWESSSTICCNCRRWGARICNVRASTFQPWRSRLPQSCKGQPPTGECRF